ncbi:MAG: hypothetical protein HY975_02530 [Candidatus Kerfeldbacteria bacterium]|nr:hypothetical protein [Candidatus Kerfeldbacteria bacterium]
MAHRPRTRHQTRTGHDSAKPSTLGSSAVVVLGLFMVGLLVPSAWSSAPAVAQSTPPSNYQTNSPHWSHLNVLDFARAARGIPNLTTRNAAYAWLVRHVDVMETSMDNSTYQAADTLSTYLHGLNPTLKTFGYDYDLTMCQRANCNQAVNTPHPLFTALPEDQYLHVSEDTQVEFRDLNGVTIETITIPGCPEPQPLSANCRLQLFIWTQKRWVSNPANVTWQQATADRFVQELQTNSAGQANVIDGLFIDEHGPGFSTQLGIGNQTRILSGGGIREYNGLRPSPYDGVTPSSLDTQYTTDLSTWLTYLQTRLAAAGKFAHINTAEYFSDPLALNNGLAMRGAMTEHINRANSNGILGASRYQAMLNGIQQMTQAGGTVDLAGSWCDDGPAGYTAGNYTSPKLRYQMWSLASYYLAKEAVGDPGKVYFDSNLCIKPNDPNPLDFFTEWLPAYEQNVGQPIEPVTIAAQGALACDSQGYKVFSRWYEHARILGRVKDGHNCNDYGDATAVTIPLAVPMRMLKPDGTLSANMTSVSIRSGEAVILFTSTDLTAPAPVSDLR